MIKDIEEMTKVIAVNCGECYTCKYQGNINCVDFLAAEALYNAGYRKIPENAVLTREKETKLFNDYVEYVKLVRKETAEKFAERLKAMAYESTDWSHGVHPMVVEVDYIDEIAEEITKDEK